MTVHHVGPFALHHPVHGRHGAGVGERRVERASGVGVQSGQGAAPATDPDDPDPVQDLLGRVVAGLQGDDRDRMAESGQSRDNVSTCRSRPPMTGR